jgi:hypothetical protein
MSRRRRAAPKPLQGPMAAKIALRAEAHVMSRGKEEVRGREAEREGSRTLRRGQLQPTAKKRTVLYCLSVCLSVYSPPLNYSQQQQQHDHACQRQTSREPTLITTDTTTPESLTPEQSPRRKTDRPTSRALQSLHTNTPIVGQDTSQLKRLYWPPRYKEAANTSALSAFESLQKDTANRITGANTQIHHGRRHLPLNGQDLRQQRNAPADAWSRRCRKDQYVSSPKVVIGVVGPMDEKSAMNLRLPVSFGYIEDSRDADKKSNQLTPHSLKPSSTPSSSRRAPPAKSTPSRPSDSTSRPSRTRTRASTSGTSVDRTRSGLFGDTTSLVSNIHARSKRKQREGRPHIKIASE